MVGKGFSLKDFKSSFTHTYDTCLLNYMDPCFCYFSVIENGCICIRVYYGYTYGQYILYLSLSLSPLAYLPSGATVRRDCQAQNVRTPFPSTRELVTFRYDPYLFNLFRVYVPQNQVFFLSFFFLSHIYVCTYMYNTYIHTYICSWFERGDGFFSRCTPYVHVHTYIYDRDCARKAGCACRLLCLPTYGWFLPA